MATGYRGIINKSILTKKCYSMYCEYCDVEFMIKVKSPPTRKKHTCGRWATQRCSGYAWTQKSDDTIRRKVARADNLGYDKDQAKLFYDSAIAGTKRRIEGVGGAQHYKVMTPDMDYMVANGIATKNTDIQSEKITKARKEVLEKTGKISKKINPKRSNNRQSIK